VHSMGIKEGGATAVLAGVGPMGLGAIDYAIHCDRKPGLLVVTDIDTPRLERAASIFTVEEAKKNGVELVYVNTAEEGKGADYLKSLTPNGDGFDDVFVYAPVKPVVEQADAILGFDGCLNFFAGPSNAEFSASFNFYNVHPRGRNQRREYRRHARIPEHDGRRTTQPLRHDHACRWTRRRD